MITVEQLKQCGSVRFISTGIDSVIFQIDVTIINRYSPIKAALEINSSTTRGHLIFTSATTQLVGHPELKVPPRWGRDQLEASLGEFLNTQREVAGLMVQAAGSNVNLRTPARCLQLLETAIVEYLDNVADLQVDRSFHAPKFLSLAHNLFIQTQNARNHCSH